MSSARGYATQRRMEIAKSGAARLTSSCLRHDQCPPGAAHHFLQHSRPKHQQRAGSPLSPHVRRGGRTGGARRGTGGSSGGIVIAQAAHPASSATSSSSGSSLCSSHLLWVGTLGAAPSSSAAGHGGGASGGVRAALGKPLARSRRMVLLSAAAPSAPEAPTSSSAAGEEGLNLSVEFDNKSDPQCTVMKVIGRNDTEVLAQVTTVLNSVGVSVSSANINSGGGEGPVTDIFRLTNTQGKKLSEDEFPALRQQLLAALQSTTRSSKPSIFGAVAEADTATLRGQLSSSDPDALEAAAAEMAAAAAALVAAERQILAAHDSQKATLGVLQEERAEAASLLERRLAAMEALLTARRQVAVAAVEAVEPQLPDFMQPPPTVRTSGPAAGNGYEIIFQGFNWESSKEPWYKKLSGQAAEIAEAGFTAIWLPPSSDSVSPQGYLPRDLYDLNSKFGSEAELRDCIAVFHEQGIKVIADIVINHRCAHYQGDDGKWNKFGGRLAWDKSVICSNNPAFGGAGSWKQCEDYPAAPNIDHTQERVRKDISEWMRYLRNSIGFDGWRFDYVKGYEGRWIREYVDATVPEMAFGEYWDTCSYTDGVLNYSQDSHRQRTVDWCDATGGTAAAFDFTLKGIMQEAVSRREYWRLIDSQGRPPGVLGIWPSRAITFLENHDTGSTLNHWPFPWKHLPEAYCYLLTHCGTPCVFYDHFYFDPDLRQHILELTKIRKRFGINAKSEVAVRKAYNELYAAVIDKKIAMKMGPGDWSPTSDKVDVGQKKWELLHSGFQFAVWQAVF